jgi:hypothetical protein
MCAGAVGLAVVGARFDWSPARRAALLVATIGASTLAVALAARAHRTFDWTEARRASLPPAAVEGLRAIDAPIAIDVWLDVEDSRRRQLDRDVLAKLRLARGDLRVETSADAQATAVAHDDRYGVLVIHVGDVTRETRSTSRKEIVQLIFDAAGRPLPDWSAPEYSGYPAVIDGTRRSFALFLAYLLIPASFLVVGGLRTRKRRR